MRLLITGCTGFLAGFLAVSGALAQVPSAAESATVWQQERLLGDFGGLRPKLEAAGITFGLQDINEVWGNASGGRRRTVDYNGATMLSFGLDTKAAQLWTGGIFNVSAWQIRGRSLATDATSALQTNSGINARGATRLWEAWYQQTFAGGAADIKIGQQSLDQEFMSSAGSSLFLNTMMGWPMLPSANLYAGGPAYPLSSLGVRLRVRPNENFTLLGGVFQDNPPGGPFDNDSPLRGSTRWGGNFSLRTGARWWLGRRNTALTSRRPGKTASQSRRRGCRVLTNWVSGMTAPPFPVSAFPPRACRCRPVTRHLAPTPRTIRACTSVSQLL